MKVRAQTSTALRALLDICLYSAPQVPSPLSEIARRQAVSAAFLEQLFRRLKAAGLVQPWRGMKGGYTLSRPPQEISLLQIFEALHDPSVMPRRVKEGAEPQAEAKVLDAAIAEAASIFRDKLASLSLEELRRRAALQPDLRGVPRPGAGFSI
jgi:Rrf2 family iron-sulfur cluster assembly transcriptional regulator